MNTFSNAPCQSVEVTEFLIEIARVLPTVKTQFHRDVIEGARDYLLAHSAQLPPEGGDFQCLRGNLETLCDVIETLRCCGVAPPGWPAPPPPEALIRARQVFVPNMKSKP